MASNQVVKINVGGISYTTTLNVLTKYPESNLGKMCLASISSPGDDGGGHFFIDRDGLLFRYILNFLRTGKLNLPDGFQELAALREEAEYYHILPLLDALKDYSNANSNGLYIEIYENCFGGFGKLKVVGPIGKNSTARKQNILPEALVADYQAKLKQQSQGLCVHNVKETRLMYGALLQQSGWTLIGSLCSQGGSELPISMKMSNDLVQLNVGGTIFTTTRSTLCRYPDSMLGAMFNGSMATTLDSQGHFFIDRDGEMFRYVLNFLRSSHLCLPEGFKEIDLLSSEADFYQIQPLIHAVNDLKVQSDKKDKQSGHFLEVVEIRTGSTATMPTNNARVKTVISGRKDVILALPIAASEGQFEKLQNRTDADFTELELNGCNIRLKLAEYLKSSGWTLLNANMTSSSGYDSKSIVSSLMIEHSYRDRWYCKHK